MSFKTIAASKVEMTQLMLPSHSNFGGKIHGGFILSLMDQIAFACASKHCGKYAVTASVDTVDFLNPVEIGEMLTLRASINYTGRTSMVVGIRVESENITNQYVRHCNSSYFTMVAKEDGKSASVPGLLLTNTDEVRRFVRSQHRKEQKMSRKKEFVENNFEMEAHLEKLKGQNVRLEL